MWSPMGRLKRSRFMITLMLGGILGFSIGACLLNALLSYRIDNFYNEILYLNTVIENKNARLERLETSFNNKFIMTDIKVYLSYSNNIKEEETTSELDELDKVTIENAILAKYRKLIGREVKDIDSSILADIIDNRIMKTDHAEYKLHVTKIVLTNTLELWVDVKSNKSS